MSQHRELFGQETGRISRIGHGLDDEQWDAPSLCTGWRVRDVIGHMTMGATFPLAKVGALVATRYKGNVHRGSNRESIKLADSLDREALMNRYDAARAHPKGVAGLLPAKVSLVDSVIHELDIRLALGLDDPFPDEIADEALSLCTTVSTPLLPIAKWTRGLSVSATDRAWSRPVAGGPGLSGPTEWLIAAMAGRHAGLGRVEGDGVRVIVERTHGTMPEPAT